MPPRQLPTGRCGKQLRCLSRLLQVGDGGKLKSRLLCWPRPAEAGQARGALFQPQESSWRPQILYMCNLAAGQQSKLSRQRT